MEAGILGAVITLVVLIYSVILHEIAHGYVADRFGDPTARLSGRLTLNPKNHIDLFGSILLPLSLILFQSPFLIGWAKPVPVDEFNLREGRKDVALVSLAGPLTNIILAITASLCMKGLLFLGNPNETTGSILALLYPVVHINLLLAIFNLLPIPPLDGSKIFALLLPEREARAFLSLGQMGMFLLLLLLFFPIAGFSLSDLLYRLLTVAQNFLLP